ncbi:MAG: nucleoside 2-deoxyribosyltransferase, partial [Chloroflexi bacterium]|nr:nucleoside 2-deoxyribosyltransferase [Chloroflexota bacterium]
VKRLADAIHAKGGWDVMHSDGYLWPILDDLVSAGIDGWQGIQPRIGMDMKELKERFGDRLCLFGGVDIDTLVRGTTEDVAAQVDYAIANAARDGGLVLGSGNTIMPGVRPENYQAMLDATRRGGAYPAHD